MERRGFFKSLLGVLALPFAKDLVKELPKPTTGKALPVSLYWSNASAANCWQFKTPTVTVIQSEAYNVSWSDWDISPSGNFIPINEAIEHWSAT